MGAGLAAQDADTLYADRTNLSSARSALELLSRAATERPDDFDTAWKLGRAAYWVGEHAPEQERRSVLERGVAASEAARRLQPSQPEGHFWAAANMGALAESFGLRVGLRYRKPIKEALETVLRLDPSFMAGSADRALGRWYFRVPRLFGGNKRAAEDHLRASLRYSPTSTISHFFLAELFLDQGRKAEARDALNAVLSAPLSREWAPEDEDYKRKARELVTRIQ